MKKRIITSIVCALTLLCAFSMASCGESRKEPETITEQVAYIIEDRFEGAGYTANTECDNEKQQVTVTVTKDKHEKVSILNANKYLDLAAMPGRFSLFMLNYGDSYFEILNTDEIEKAEIVKNGNKKSIKLTIDDSTRAKYYDATETAISLDSPIYVLLDHAIVGAYLPEEPVDSNEILVESTFDAERAGTLKACIDTGVMPCGLKVSQSSFDEKGNLAFVVTLVPESEQSEEEVEEAIKEAIEEAIADEETEESAETEETQTEAE